MTVEDADELVLFQDVRIIRATAPAVLCGIGDKRVWLPRAHISGKLWCAGDRGRLFVRRWVAQDRHLLDSIGTDVVSDVGRSVSRRRAPGGLYAVKGRPGNHGASHPAAPRGEPRSTPTKLGEREPFEGRMRQAGPTMAVTTLMDARRSRRPLLTRTPDTERPA